MDNPQGIWVGEVNPDENMAAVKTPSGKIEVYIPELADQAQELDAASEAKGLRMPDEFPMILNAGRHMDTNANTLMRNPEWNRGKRACTVAVSPSDAAALDLMDGDLVQVVTKADKAVGELQISGQVREGTVLIPNGFGLTYDGEVYGINVNRLTRSTHRDPLGTPLHRYVPCRLEKVD